jgi:hypothetical protein
MRIIKAKTPWFRPGERLLTVKVTFVTAKQADIDAIMNLAGSGVSVRVVPVEAEPVVAPAPVVETVSCEVEEVKALPPAQKETW